jgi:hypothetical protein
MELYVYYRVGAADAAEATQAVLRVQHALRDAWPGLTARLLHRDEPAPQPGSGAEGGAVKTAIPADVTFMEVYYRAGRPFDARQLDELDAQAQAAVAPWTVGSRHRERFTDCLSRPIA